MSEVYFQTVEVNSGPRPTGGMSNFGSGVAAGVKLLQKSLVWLNGWGLSRYVNQEIDKLMPQILPRLVRGRGVLLCVGIQEWNQEFEGAKMQSFLSVHVAAEGVDPQSCLREYLSQPQLSQGAPKGWIRKDVFIWVSH